ncbi:ribosomal protein L10.e [Candidatus Methanoperedens nitroreducens]|uniref:Large ribosomal subunit protein uL16 n=1 Tax=Candidatus Methanoperedens nitratireducens TaxID=1392998 RepID=A0A062VES8_9EURY|nr:50S ribosomal protein L16 [Candidatus Methanoperedens nitroreducens]KCZ73700.1 ribosomal protein L10.e [Candidatus Methanoperedens nitroreducens]MDJ1422341.1 50S ribosomal protein L16 [Candidatus Methanoperedens sp.]
MARKPARMYRNITRRSYTRREYMGGVPGSKIVTYDMGNLKDEFPVQISITAKEACQIRHSALESARIAANRILLDSIGQTGYHLKIRVFPHEVLRENKQATGAGADRVSQGMRQAFGKAVSTAARVDAGQKIMTLSINPGNFKQAKESLIAAGHKLPTPIRLIIEKGQELVLT